MTILGLFIHKTYGKKSLQFNDTPFYYFPIAIVLGISYVIFQEYLIDFYFWVINEPRLYISEFKLKNAFEYFDLPTVLMFPIIEEFFFRRYIQDKLQKDYRPIITIGVTTLLFTMIHTPFFALFSSLYDFSFYLPYMVVVGGLIASILYYKSGNVWSSILFHITWNFAAGGFY